ncbi:hypothetical protein D3C83_08300 [compost metagenome]
MYDPVMAPAAWYSESMVRCGTLPRAISISDTPGRSRSRGSGCTPSAWMKVGNPSASVTGVSQTLPSGTPGPARIIGMPADSSYIVDLPHSPRVPRLSPWSDE